MGNIRKDFKYKIVKNFLTKDEILLLKEYCYLKHISNIENFDYGIGPNCDTYFEYDVLMESLLKIKTELVEKETNLKLFPTYSYWRMYTYGSNLLKHKDRPSCEISVSIKIGSDGTKWPIFMENESVELEEGDGVIYLGCEIEHWREKFIGDWNAQVFMHYVDQNGPFKEAKYDFRHQLGFNRSYCNNRLREHLEEKLKTMDIK